MLLVEPPLHPMVCDVQNAIIDAGAIRNWFRPIASNEVVTLEGYDVIVVLVVLYSCHLLLQIGALQCLVLKGQVVEHLPLFLVPWPSILRQRWIFKTMGRSSSMKKS